jgi:hypothetical protein
MNLDQLLEVVDHLSPEEREKLREHLSEWREPSKQRTVDEWIAELEDIAHEFRGDSSDEEMAEITAAMNTKSKPSEI